MEQTVAAFVVTEDEAYDDQKCFAWAKKNQIKAMFPPRIGAKIQQHGNSKRGAWNENPIVTSY